jgi:hypothetical protein
MKTTQETRNFIPIIAFQLKELSRIGLNNAEAVGLKSEVALAWHCMAWKNTHLKYENTIKRRVEAFDTIKADCEKNNIPICNPLGNPYKHYNMPIHDVCAIYMPFYKLIRKFTQHHNCMINTKDSEQQKQIIEMIKQKTQCIYLRDGWTPTSKALHYLLKAYKHYCFQGQKYKFIKTIRAYILERNGIFSYNDAEQEEIKARFAKSTDGWTLTDQEYHYLLNKYQKYWEKQQSQFYEIIEDFIAERNGVISYNDAEQNELKKRFAQSKQSKHFRNDLSLSNSEFRELCNTSQQIHANPNVTQDVKQDQPATSTAIDPMTIINAPQQFPTKEFTESATSHFCIEGSILTGTAFNSLLNEEYPKPHTSTQQSASSIEFTYDMPAFSQALPIKVEEPFSTDIFDTAIDSMAINMPQQFPTKKFAESATSHFCIEGSILTGTAFNSLLNEEYPKPHTSTQQGASSIEFTYDMPAFSQALPIKVEEPFSTDISDTAIDPMAINTPQQFPTYPTTFFNNTITCGSYSAHPNLLNGTVITTLPHLWNTTIFDDGDFAALCSVSPANNGNLHDSIASPQYNPNNFFRNGSAPAILPSNDLQLDGIAELLDTAALSYTHHFCSYPASAASQNNSGLQLGSNPHGNFWPSTPGNLDPVNLTDLLSTLESSPYPNKQAP